MRSPILVSNLLVLPFLLALTGCGKPVLDLPASVTVIGQATPITVHVHDPHGISKLTATLEQNGAQYQAWQTPAATKETDASLHFEVGVKTTPQLKDGPARLVLEATSGGPLHGTTRWEGEVTVATQPPLVSADSEQHYLYLGMADLATLNITGGGHTSAGVRVGDQTFRAWPMPGGKPGLFSLYAFAWNMPAGTTPLVFASNGTGNDVATPLTVVFPKREQPVYTQHEIQVTDQFMQKVLGELDPNGTGDPVARFVRVNTEMRRDNNRTLADLRLKTAESFLWSQPFARQAAKAEATFADVRSYMYHGKKIDQQVHLGYDLASTQHMGVQASNDGVVVYAAPLGIYGNCIVVDHGYGLQTIYGHLSRIDVKEGDAVKRSQVMGLSGMTGMAGGDHVHFAMQLDGVQIDPKEWWDAHWIKDHIARRVDLPGFGK